MSELALQARIGRLEAESAVRQVIARYFQACDQLGPGTDFDALGQLFAPDAVWEGKGRYATAFGTRHGRAAIVEMLRHYAMPAPHFAMTAHFYSSENIVVDDAGAGAQGKWMMLQTTTYADGTADLRSARLDIQLTRERRVWRICRFSTENIFSRRIDRWNDAAAIPVPSDRHAEQTDDAH